jgi:hypothetical protein
MNELAERQSELEQFANAGGQQIQPIAPPHGHALVRPSTGLAERVIGAQPVAVYRDETKILQKLSAMAAAAGTDWFYRFPVKTKGGGSDWIEGPSIKLANDVARIYGNNVNEIREIDVGDAWVFYARFTDIESGFSMERAYRQRKSQTSMKTKDQDRQLDISYQIGQSKAIRNVICNALQLFADYAFEHARNSLVEKIGKNLEGYRNRTLQGLAAMPVELTRVERVIGRAARDWLAPNIAQIVAMMKSVADGMASIDEVFPQLETTSAAAPAAADATNSAAADKQQAGGAQPSAEPNAGTGQTGNASSGPSAGAAAATAATDRIVIAHRRGQEAKAAGHGRKAVPMEYREAAHQAEADAWCAGWDGKHVPTEKGLV